MPTAFPTPCPRGPVVASTPGVRPFSGCPGVLEPNCLKFLSSSISSQPTKDSIAYRSADS